MIWKTAAGLTKVLTPESGELSLAEKCTYTEIFEGTYATCLSAAMGKGTAGTDYTSEGRPNLTGWYIAHCTVRRSRGGKGTLTLTWEPGNATASLGATLPPTDYTITPQMNRMSLIRHPDFAALRTEAFCKQLWIWEHIDPKDGGTKWDAAKAEMVSIGNGISAGLGTTFVAKLFSVGREIDIPGVRVEVNTCSWAFPAGYTFGVFALNSSIPSIVGCTWPSGWDWRRQPDIVRWNGSYHTLVSVWEGAPSGAWDSTYGS